VLLAWTVATAPLWVLLELVYFRYKLLLLLEKAKFVVPVHGHTLECVGIALVVSFLNESALAKGAGPRLAKVVRR